MTGLSDDGRRWLDAAARLSRRGRPSSSPNPAVGAVIVCDGRVVGQGWTQTSGRPHAEAVALEQAGRGAKGGSVYVTLEPCAHRSPRGPACCDLLIEAGVGKVVIGQVDPDLRTNGEGIERLRAAGVHVTLVDHEASANALAGYLTRQRYGRPFTTLKLAMSLDGRIALPDGSSRWITGEAARAHVHARRAQHDAIIVGGGTWRADRPSLDVRLPGLSHRSPQTAVLTRGSIEGATALPSPQSIGEHGWQYAYVEGGAGAAAAFLAADLVDRLDIYRAPIIIGEGLPAIGNIGLESLDDAHGRWTPIERRQLGSDTYEAYRRNRPAS